MNISLDWLKEYVDLPGDPGFIAERLTAIGIEVERVVALGGGLEGVVVGEIQALERHPNADQLWIARVSTGNQQLHQVVTGAGNVRVGDRVPMAPVGARLADGTRLVQRRLRGVDSYGMICSPKELALGEDAAGIMILDQQAPVGADLTTLYPPDTLLECEVSPSRPDCLSHLGVARELAAATGRVARPPLGVAGRYPPGAAAPTVRVEILDSSLCRRYIARVIRNVQVAASPEWLQRRLRAVGLRPINNVVDVTNFVLMEVGQPLHAFDFDRLHGPRIEVRLPRPGERLRTLDDDERLLTEGMLVIADADRAVALAGLIGGSDTAVTEATRHVLLESATFEGPNIRATSRALGFRTEASIRFEKQLSPALAQDGADRAARLLEDVTGGRAGESGEAYPRPFTPRRVVLEAARLHRILGPEVTLTEGGEILQRLGFQVQVGAERLEAEGPPVRLDVNIPEDLVEEIGRMRGYQRITPTLPGHRTPVRDLFVAQDLEERVRAFLAGAGFDEVVTYAFTSRLHTSDIGIPDRPTRMLEIAKPLSIEWDALRTSQLPGLLRTASANARVDVPQVRIFELGHVFWPRGAAGKQPEEPLLLSFLETVPGGDAPTSKEALRRLKGVVERLRSDFARQPVTILPATCPGFHPGRCAVLRAGEELLGVLGEVHPQILEQAGVEGRAVVAELRLAEFAAGGVAEPQAEPVSRFPAVIRELAVIVARATLSEGLVQVIRESGGYTLTEVQIREEYEGPQAGAGRRSLLFHLTFQAPDRTLTSEEVNATLGSIARRLEAGGAEIRGRI